MTDWMMSSGRISEGLMWDMLDEEAVAWTG